MNKLDLSCKIALVSFILIFGIPIVSLLIYSVLSDLKGVYLLAMLISLILLAFIIKVMIQYNKIRLKEKSKKSNDKISLFREFKKLDLISKIIVLGAFSGE